MEAERTLMTVCLAKEKKITNDSRNVLGQWEIIRYIPRRNNQVQYSLHIFSEIFLCGVYEKVRSQLFRIVLFRLIMRERVHGCPKSFSEEYRIMSLLL